MHVPCSLRCIATSVAAEACPETNHCNGFVNNYIAEPSNSLESGGAVSAAAVGMGDDIPDSKAAPRFNDKINEHELVPNEINLHLVSPNQTRCSA